MDHSQFHIGLDFWCGCKRWRCSDVGSRVVVAISLEPHEVVRLEVDPRDPAKRTEHKCVTDDPSWFNGPPYGIVEHVFDEDSIVACALTKDEEPSPFSLDELVSLITRSDIDIEQYFRELHHFSQHPPFSTRPSSFRVFADYCRAQPTGIEPGGENERTIQRAYAFVQFLRSRTAEESVALAWKGFPLAKTYSPGAAQGDG